VQTRPAHTYIFTGVLHWHFHTIGAGSPVFAVADSPGALAHLDQYLANLAALGFEVTSNAVWELRGVRAELAAKAPGSVLDEDTAAKIRRVAVGAQQALYGEATSKEVFVVSEKRFPVPKLLYDIDSLFRVGTFVRLPANSAVDFMNAGRCLAFECTTASAFHALRATEGVLRHYYSCVVRRNRLAEPWGWWAMTDQMSKRRTPPPRVLLDAVDGLRENFRNPTAHPEKHYDVDEAEELLGGCIDVVNRMVRANEWSDPDDSWGVLLDALQTQAEAAQQEPQVPTERQ
jgi:hypothetical protein